MTLNQMVFTLCLSSAMFLAGMHVGEGQAAVKLQPCPQAGKPALIRTTVTGQVCTYVELTKDKRKYRLTSVAL